MGLEQIRAQDEDSAVGELRVCYLQLDAFPANDRPILAPVELESLSGREDQGHEGSAPAGLGLALPLVLPCPDEGCNTIVRAVIPQHDKVGVHMLRRPSLLASLGRLRPQPSRHLLGERVEFARTIRNLELRLNRAGAKVFADRVPGQSCPALNLPDRHPLAEMPAPDDAQ